MKKHKTHLSFYNTVNCGKSREMRNKLMLLCLSSPYFAFCESAHLHGELM